MADNGSKKLGLWTSTSLVVGNMIGSGIFLMPAAMAAFGGIGLIGWLFSAVGAFFIAKTFSNMSKLEPGVTGGPYAYTRAGLGDFPAFLVAWGYCLSTCCACTAIVVSFISAMSAFFPVLAHDTTVAAATGLITIWVITWINSGGVALSGRFQLITTILKLVPLLLVAIGGLFFIKAANFHPFNLSGKPTFDAITTTAAMTMFAFVGIECATIPAGSVENSAKTVSRATILGCLIVTGVYILGSFSVMGVIPSAALGKSPTPFGDAAAVIYGPSAKYVVSAGVAIAALGALNGWVLMLGQVPLAIASDKLFPGVFGRTNKKGVPAVGMIISCTVISGLIAMNFSKGLVDQFRFLLLLATLGMLVPYLLSSASYIVMTAKKDYSPKGGIIAVIFLGMGGVCYALWEIMGTGQLSVFYGFLYLMAGVPFYVWVAYKKAAAAKSSAADELTNEPVKQEAL